VHLEALQVLTGDWHVVATGSCVQLGALSVLDVVPGEHAVHCRSETLDPDALTYVPGWQSFHAEQLDALLAALYAPNEHGLQDRSLVAAPCACTN
jgi:hypothetical protein